MMFSAHTKMPRNLRAPQAAAILYGDWGTSKAYVLGLAFALAGYSSFWLIALTGVLNILVGLSYVIICKCYPEGGGVYASLRNKSRIRALVGAFCLIADYLVTAALSALSAFYYLGVSHPEYWAISAIAVIGWINFLGPKHTGNLAFLIAIPTVIVVFLIGIFSIPHLHYAIENVEPLKGGVLHNWQSFVSIIVALSGIESIANITGVMKLDPGSTEAKPSVSQTSTPAIVWVMLEVSIMTTLFGLAMCALPGLTVSDHTVHAPGHIDVRDYMLRYMGYIFSANLISNDFGILFGYTVSIVFAGLLLSAVNSATVALESLLFVMSRDGELPEAFQKLNVFGVPYFPLLVASAIPIGLLALFSDIATLADLYAVGFVGAIATNIGSTALDKKIEIHNGWRTLMIVTFVIMVVIELTLLIDKPHARNFAIAIIAGGLFLRGLVMERAQNKERALLEAKAKTSKRSVLSAKHVQSKDGAVLCPVTHPGKTLDFAIEECKQYGSILYLLFVREQHVITEADKARDWLNDPQACAVFDHAIEHQKEVTIRFSYAVSDSIAHTIVEEAEKLKVSRIIVGMPRKSKFLQLIHGNILQELGKIIPQDIDLIVIS